MTTVAPSALPATGTGQEGGPAAPSAGEIWRRWRTAIAVTAATLIAGAAIALLQPAATGSGYLDPASTRPAGTRALADILAQRGHQVIRARTAAAAAAAAGQGGATLVVTSPQFLTRRQLRTLALAPGSLVIVEPDAAALTALAPGVTLAGESVVGAVPPDCPLTAAQLAGNADMGGLWLKLHPASAGAAACYPAGGLPTLVRYSPGGKLVTILGTGTPLENASLDQLGNAALALNLLSSSPRIVWLAPAEPSLAGAGPSGTPRSLTSLVPLGAYLVAIQLGIAVLLCALWRARRLGPLVPEQLPVVIRASETVEGHARLYQARRARGRAAAALRTATLSRLLPAAGLAHGAPPDAVTSALAARSRLGAGKLEMMLFGPAPGDDAALVGLADDLDALEREVRAQ